MKKSLEGCSRTLAFFTALWALSLLFFVGISAFGRLVLWVFAAGADFAMPDAARAWFMGLRYDLMAGAYLALPALVAAVAALIFPKRRTRLLSAGIAVGIVFSALLIVCLVVDFGFFCEYQDQFNVWALGIVYDDMNAVVRTFFLDYHVFRYLSAIVVLVTFVSFWAFPRSCRKILSGIKNIRVPAALGVLTLLLLAFFNVLILRGRLSGRPIGVRDAAVCADDLKNRLILNPLIALKYVVVDLKKVSDGSAVPNFVTNLDGQIRLAFGVGKEELDGAIVKKNVPANKNTGFSPPKQVFLIVMESGDYWPLREEYAELGIADALKTLAENGASSDNFISGSSGTMLSLSALVSGVPDIGVAQNYRPAGRKQLPVSLAGIFKKLGYKTRFAYAGYEFWQHIGRYVKDQGFDEFVFGSDVDCPEKFKGEWGVPDGFLFEHLEKLAEKDAGTPVFTLVLTASNHPPYSLTEEVAGYKDFQMPKKFEALYDGKAPLQVYAHARYGYQSVAAFVKKTGEKIPESLFAITGDHFSRRFLNANPGLPEKKQVPFVLCGAGVPTGTRLPFGTHADIAPTLVSLCAPEGFAFPSFGENLFSDEARSRLCTYGEGVVLHKDGGFLIGGKSNFYGKELSEETIKTMEELVRARRAAAWFYFEKK